MPHPASFRIAMLDDVGCILPMVRELYALDHIPFDEQRVRAALLDLLQHPSYGCAWVILDGAEPAGYLIVTFDFSLEYGGREAFIDELFIRESRRHQGFGMLAVAHAEAFC